MQYFNEYLSWWNIQDRYDGFTLIGDHLAQDCILFDRKNNNHSNKKTHRKPKKCIQFYHYHWAIGYEPEKCNPLKALRKMLKEKSPRLPMNLPNLMTRNSCLRIMWLSCLYQNERILLYVFLWVSKWEWLKNNAKKGKTRIYTAKKTAKTSLKETASICLWIVLNYSSFNYEILNEQKRLGE